MTDDPMQRLIKLVEMTGSPNDHEALVAVRKANALIKQQGWSWGELFGDRQAIFHQGVQNGFRMAQREFVPTFNVVFR